MSDPTPSPRRLAMPASLSRPMVIAAIAFAVGLLLFLLLWFDQRSESEFFKAGKPVAGEDVDGEGLPAPVPADVAGDVGNASGLQFPRQSTEPMAGEQEQPRLVEPPAPPPPVAEPVPAPTRSAASAPVPVSRPAPRYPRDALRRNIGGMVRVKATVAPDGSVERLELEQGSGNRELDRAALEAVRRWRFQPAMRDGQPVTESIVVPLEFRPEG